MIVYYYTTTKKLLTVKENPSYIPNINEKVYLESDDYNYIYKGFVIDKQIMIYPNELNINIYVKINSEEKIDY